MINELNCYSRKMYNYGGFWSNTRRVGEGLLKIGAVIMKTNIFSELLSELQDAAINTNPCILLTLNCSKLFHLKL